MKRVIGLALGLSLLGATVASAQNYHSYQRDNRDDRQQDWNRDGDHHDWDRSTFDREYGSRGADWDHRWRRGDRLPDGYAADQRYVVGDYRHHHLSRPAYGYRWVRYGNGYIQVRSNGYVNRTVYGTRY